MGLKLNYVDEYKETYPNAYARPEVCHLDKANRFFSAKFIIYSEKGKRPIGTKTYNILGDDFDKYFPVMDENIMKVCYKIAKDTKDTQDKSFFEDAIDS